MKADDEALMQVLHNNSFEIPVYQRNYEWGHSQVTQLLEDIDGIIKELKIFDIDLEQAVSANVNHRILEGIKEDKKQYSYFIGCLVVQNDGGGKPYYIIDGQQRITTISLIMIALRDLYNKFPSLKNTTLENEFKNRIKKSHSNGTVSLTLKPIESDNIVYEHIVNNDIESLRKEHTESQLYINYNKIKNKIENSLKKAEYSIDDIWEALTKLKIVLISVTKEDKPQKIFESLNSTGKDLAEADLIRNYVLMSLCGNEKPEDIYHNYWRKIEENCNKYDLTEFMRYFLIFKKQSPVQLKKVYEIFKKQYPEINKDHLDEIKRFSSIFKKIKSFDYDQEFDMQVLYIFDNLKFGVSLSVQFQIFDLYEQKNLSREQAKDCMMMLESFFVRSKICEKDKGLNKVLPSVIRNIKRNDGINYIDALRDALAHYHFPSDTDTKNKLKTFDLYKDKTFCKYFLVKLELYGDKNHPQKIDDYLISKEITIEHIYPKKPNK